MLSYVLPTEDKPPPGDANQSNLRANRSQRSPKDRPPRKPSSNGASHSPSNFAAHSPSNFAGNLSSEATSSPCTKRQHADATRTMLLSTKIEGHAAEQAQSPTQSVSRQQQAQRQQHAQQGAESPKHNGTGTKKSTLHSSTKVTKDESLYSIDSEASTVGSDRKGKIFNGAKHASLKRVSFGSSKGSMVETLVYETPVQEEPEMNHFMDHNGRIPTTITPVPDTDEGREKVRVSLLGPQPSPATPGVLLLEPISQPAPCCPLSTNHPLPNPMSNPMSIPIDMANSPAELLTAHTEHTTPAYHAQISTDSGWDNPFRPDGDLSREADEIVELIKGGKPITPTPGQNGQNGPGLPTLASECNAQTGLEGHDPSASPLLKARPGQENGNAHGTPMKKPGAANSQQPVNEKVGGASRAATVEVARMTSQGPGDASQVEHVTLKKKPKCKCCVLQ